MTCTRTILLAVLLVVGLACGAALFRLSLPAPAKESDGASKEESVDAYLRGVYAQPQKDPSSEGESLLKDAFLAPSGEGMNWLWDTLPDEARSRFPISKNSSLVWPPAKGSRSRIAAFPYPSDMDASHFASNFAKVLKVLLNSTYDQATFPGWMVSIYEPYSPNANGYGAALRSHFKWDSSRPPGDPSAAIGKVLTEKDVGTTVRITRAKGAGKAVLEVGGGEAYDWPLGPQAAGSYFVDGVELGGAIVVLAGKRYPVPIKRWPVSAGSSPLDLEATHACYPPSGTEYPTCDDGGYWLYLTPGSGVFWSSGRHVLVANNKIDAAIRLLSTDRVRAYVSRTEGFAFPPLDATASSNEREEGALRYLSHTFADAKGGKNMVLSIAKVVFAFQRAKRKTDDDGAVSPNEDDEGNLLLAAFRRMDASDATPTWGGWVVCGTAYLFLLAGLLLCAALSLFRFRKEGLLSATASSGAYLVLAAGLGALVVLVVTDLMIKGFGWITLQNGMDETGLSLRDFILCAAGEAEEEGRHLPSCSSRDRLVCNGFAITQALDSKLEVWSSLLGLDSFLLHAQPNKAGMWTCEMCDLRNFRAALLSGDGTELSLGMCGQKAGLPSPTPSVGADGCVVPIQVPKGTSFKGGPVNGQWRHSLKETFLRYTPCGPCNCDEKAIAEAYDGDVSSLYTCVNCGTLPGGKESYSKRMCAPA